MNDPKREERRRRLLKERKAAERREFDRVEANYLYQAACRDYRIGDVPAAARLLKKALVLDPEHCPSMELLADIHFKAGQYADAAYYLAQVRKSSEIPTACYNLGLAHLKLGRVEQARKDFQDFLDATKFPRDRRLLELRESARRLLLHTPEPAPPAAPVQPVERHETPAPEPKPEPPRVAVEFPPAVAPAYDSLPTGTLTDYLLHRRLLELKLAQSFEDLLCLPSLQGVDAYHYQQETVRRVLRQFKGRALLADEVGLGKTIEACLVLKEYWQRGMVRRALVLTPPSLVSQWKGELIEKFGMTPASPDDSGFRGDPARFWLEEPLIVASIATARLEPHAPVLASAAWDMVIVDEAHALKNRASSNWKLVNSLTKKFILMLTATPVENNLLELYNLITVLKPGLLATEAEFRRQFIAPGKPKSPRNPERLRELLGEVMVRNTRAAADVSLPHRIAASVVTEPSPAEAQLYRMVSDFVAARYRGENGGAGRLALQLVQRQAGSSPQALTRSLGRALAEGRWTDRQDRRDLESMQELASQVLYTGKSVQLGRMLAEKSGKMVVFTEFTPTLEHLEEIAKQNSARHVLFHGGMSRAEKDAAIARFRDEADVLLSTGSGGEGRNLQFARTVINFDLPWSPMRLEQRVGRVHRIGQTQDVFVFNFCQAGTVEEQVLRLLHDKINMFELVVGEVDSILGILDEGRDFQDLVLDLWVSARDSGRVEQAFDELADRLVEAKKHYLATRSLDAQLFQRDFEV